jgi:cyclopropane fatty-acyl-phospholipid synthase-like methyltransferase
MGTAVKRKWFLWALLPACSHARGASLEASLPPCDHGRHGHGHHGHHSGHPASHDDSTAAYHHRFDDVARWAQEFESPERNAWQRPDDVIAALQLAPDARVADIGAGTGYFAVRLARATPRGRVWAVDVEPSMVTWMRDRARREGIENLFPVLATPDDPMLPEAVDRVLVVDTWHHIEHRRAYFQRLRGWVRPGGLVAIVDFLRDSPSGPPPEHRVPPEEVRNDMQAAGYVFERAVEGLPRQYMLLFRTPSAGP